MVYYIKIFSFYLIFCHKLIANWNIKFSHKMEVKDPTSFSQKYHKNPILFLKNFHLSEKLKSNLWVTSFQKKLSVTLKHLELNQYTQKWSYTAATSIFQKNLKFWFWNLLPFVRKGHRQNYSTQHVLIRLFEEWTK